MRFLLPLAFLALAGGACAQGVPDALRPNLPAGASPLVLPDPEDYWTMRAMCKNSWDAQGQAPEACSKKSEVFDPVAERFLCRVTYPADRPDLLAREARNCFDLELP